VLLAVVGHRVLEKMDSLMLLKSKGSAKPLPDGSQNDIQKNIKPTFSIFENNYWKKLGLLPFVWIAFFTPILDLLQLSVLTRVGVGKSSRKKQGPVKTAVLAVQGVVGHGTPAVQYTPDHGHAVQGAANPTCNSLPCVASNQQSSDYAITPNQSTHSPVYHEPTITQLATASPHRPYIPLHGQRSYIV